MELCVVIVVVAVRFATALWLLVGIASAVAGDYTNAATIQALKRSSRQAGIRFQAVDNTVKCTRMAGVSKSLRFNNNYWVLNAAIGALVLVF